ncbi:espin-like protein [Scleropages formosus]|uniref:espin-like protein n=1 Tax=Scleropages formosus TaxID=113540 RepID=UPI0010FAA44D|nr:espin-like protein [Scleropages formosus]
MGQQKAIWAAREGDLAVLKELAATKCFDGHITDPQGATPVHHAARAGHLDCLRFLVDTASLPGNARARNGATPAHDAAATGHLFVLQWLVEHGACSTQDRDNAGATALHLAARFGCVEVTQWLLSVGAQAAAETDCGVLPAHFAASKGDLTCLKLLVREAYGCVNRQTKIGATPLYLACQEGHLHIVEFLVKDCGADVHLRANDGMTCLHAAAHMGHHALVVWLASFTDISLSCQDREGATPLHFAASGGHHRILERLLRMGAKVIKDYWGGTPLHDAAENGELECCRVLLVHEVSPLEQDKDGFTAADLAQYNGHYECASFLLAVEKCPSAVDRSLSEVYISEEQSSGKPSGSRQPSTEPCGNSCGSPKMVIFSVSVHKAAQMGDLSVIKTEEEKKFNPDMRTFKSLKQAGITAVFTGQNKPDKMVLLPTEEANLCDIDYLVPTTDEKGRPIAEWKRQVMVRQLQARLQDEENQRRKENGNKYTKMDSWRYSQARNAILGPFGEMLTEDDLIYLEKQIENVAMQKNCEGYEEELARLAKELRTILPAPIVNLTVNTQFRKPSSDANTPLPLWCNRISGIVKSMSLLMTNLTDQSCCKMQNTELVSVFTQMPERQSSSRGRREVIEREIHEFGVSVRNLKANFESQNPTSVKESDEALLKPCMQEGNVKWTEQTSEELNEDAEVHQTSDSDPGCDEQMHEVMETTSLRKERIVVLFLGHWKKSAYSVTKGKDAGRKQSLDGLETTDMTDHTARGNAFQEFQSKKKMEHGSLSHFFKQRSTINKMISNWRNMNSSVPSRQIRRLHRQQVTYSPEQFLPRVHGATVDYDSLSLDLFMLGYFHILELDLPADERKMRHLLCFEVFDHLGRFPWETVRSFHKAVLQDIESGNREWKDGFEDIKIKFFGNAETMSESPSTTQETSLPEVKPVPKVIVQTPTPDEDTALQSGTEISSFSNEEICKYIDRSFAFWKEKEAEIFDFE